jgi:hypothetical protein
MSSLEQKIDALIDEMRASRNGSPGGATLRGSSDTATYSGNFLDSLFKGVESFVKNVEGAGMNIIKGTASAADIAKLLAMPLDNFGMVGRLAGLGIKDMIDAVSDVDQTLRRTSAVGLNFSNDLGAANKAIKGAQLTLPEFEQLIKYNSSSLVGLAGGVNRSAKAWLDITQQVVNSDIGIELGKAGVSTREMAEATLLANYNSRGFSKVDAESKQRMIASAAGLALQMDELAKITGKSKESQMEATKRVLDKAEVDAGIAEKGEEYQRQATSAVQKFSTMGDAVTNFIGELASGPIRSEAANAIAGALPTAVVSRLQNSFAELEAASKAGDQQRIEIAQRRLEMDRTELAKAMNNSQYRQRVANSDEAEVKAVYSGVVTYTRAVEAEQKRLQALTSDRVSFESAELSLRKKVERDTQGKGPDGKPLPGAELAEAIRGADRMGKLMGSMAANELKKMNDEVGSAGGNLAKFNRALTGIRTTQGLASNIQSLVPNVTGRSNTPTGGGQTWGQPEREEFGSKAIWGDWFAGPKGRIIQVNEKAGEAEATVPFGQRGEFVRDQLAKFPEMFKDIIGNPQTQRMMGQMSNFGNDFAGNVDRIAPELEKQFKTFPKFNAGTELPDIKTMFGPFQQMFGNLETMGRSMPNFMPPSIDFNPPNGADIRQEIPQQPTVFEQPKPQTTSSSVDETNLQKDMSEGITMLNKTMSMAVHWMEQTASYSEKLASAVQSGGNRLG